LFDRYDVEKDVDGVTGLGFGRMAMERRLSARHPAGIAAAQDYEIKIEGKGPWWSGAADPGQAVA
jgi:5,10-methylene-tetrahydrofolate dehydrogenase/methenyl tetrahydrofolate cyclohydrolase